MPNENQENLPKLSLSDSLRRLAELEEVIDGGSNPDEAIAAALTFAENQLADSVDRTIFFATALTGHNSFSSTNAAGLIGAAKEQAEAWRQKAKTYENILSRISDRVRYLLENSGHILKGSQGQVVLQKNAPSLKLGFLTSQRTFNHIIGEDDFLRVGPEYLIRTEVLQVNTKAVMDALKSEKQLEFAELEYNSHLRIKKV